MYVKYACSSLSNASVSQNDRPSRPGRVTLGAVPVRPPVRAFLAICQSAQAVASRSAMSSDTLAVILVISRRHAERIPYTKKGA